MHTEASEPRRRGSSSPPPASSPLPLRHLPDGEPDRIRLGLDLGNGVSGGRALKSSVFTLRLICTNGMVATQTLSRRKVAHRGRSERFLKRVEDVKLKYCQKNMRPH